MDLLKAEIARKKKQIEDSDVLLSEKKYFKRGDLAAKEEEAYWKKHKRLKAEIEEKVTEEEIEEDEAGGSQDAPKKVEKFILPRKEIIRRLRERGEPIILFGELEKEAFQRLRRLEMMAPEINKGFKNDMKVAMDRVDEDYLQEILRASSEDGESIKVNDVKVIDDGSTIEDILKLSDNFGHGDSSLDSDVILKFLKLILKHWAMDLNGRSREEKLSFRGKLASATHSQTISYLKPLFRKLKHKEMDSEILSCMVDIVKYLLERHYIKANDAYLEMAIGNAPWPIGVTMVGIHARTGREKIFARNVAHVLNDETQRKYIQAMKRLMTKCQKYFPTDPSRSVEFEGEVH